MKRFVLGIVVVLSTQGVGCGCGGSGGGDSGVAGSAQTAPTGFTAVAFGSARINLSWSYGSETDGFKIQRGTDGATFADIATVGKTVRDFADLRLDAATKFYYRVRAYSAAGDGAQSAVASATTGALAWSSPTLSGTAPSVRSEHAAVYANSLMVVCGGRKDFAVFGGIHALQLTGSGMWSDAEALGAARAGHTAMYDAQYDRVVVFGGGDGEGHLTNTVFQFSLNDSAWSSVTVGGSTPERRTNHTAIYDSANQRMILFGGRNGNGGALDDVWGLTLPGAAATHVWTQLGTGVARELHTALYDAPNKRMIVFGGSVTVPPGTGTPTFHNDLYAVSLLSSGAITWTPLTATGTPPSARDGAAAIYDSANQRMILFGGKTGVNSFANDVWELSLPVGGSPAWKLLSPSGATLPSPRMRHTAVYDSVNQRLVLFGGGATSGTYYNDTWLLGL